MQVGDVIAERFEVLRFAGSGGMSNVYQAQDRQTAEVVAIKILQDASARDMSRFAREAEALAALRVPGVVRYLAHGMTEQGEPYLAMEWLAGETLSERLEREGLTISESVLLGERVARTLGAVHRMGIVHRDLKPSNLMLADGDVEHVTLLDFGIARVTALEQQLTTPGVILGTPGYMAPEQARGERNIEPTADVFALGCLLYKCISGRAAFTALGGLAVLVKVLLEDPPRLSEIRQGIPPLLDDLIARMLAKLPADRPRDGDAVAAALGALQLSASGTVTRRASQTMRAPELTTGERKIMCLVVTRERLSGREVTRRHGEGTHRETNEQQKAQALHELAERCQGEVELIEARSPLIVLTGAAAPTDLAARAAHCALALHALLDGASVALVTGRAQITSRLPVGDLVDRAYEMLPAPGTPTDVVGVRIDDMTAGLLGPRFEIARDDAGRRLLSARGDAESAPELLGRVIPCVGREREIALLLAEVERCLEESAAGAVLVLSEAGMGKSRLRHELVRRIEEQGDDVAVWLGRGDPVGAGAAFGLLSSALRFAMDITEGEPLELRQRKIRSRVAQHKQLDIPRVTAFIGELVGTPFPHDQDVRLSSARRDPVLMGDQLRLAWEDFLQAECATRGVLLVLEDLHWGDLPTVSMVDSALRNLKNQRFLVLALGRPEVRRQFPNLWEGRLLHELNLTALPRRASERLVREALGARATPELVASVVARADGNAFFLEEQIRAAAEGKLEGLPDTVVAMVQARLEALDPEARRVLRAASLFGDAFWSAGVRSLLGGMQVDVWLAELKRSEVLVRRSEGRRELGAEYCFRHALVREAAYGMLTERDRRIGHALAGTWLESVGETDPMVLAEHFVRGDEPTSAAAWYLRAADQALRGNDLASAIACAERGIACGPDPATLGALLRVEAEAQLWRGDPGIAEERGLAALQHLAPGSVEWLSACVQLAWAGHKQKSYDRVQRLMSVVLSTEALEGAHTAKNTCLLEGAIVLLFGGRHAFVDTLIDAVESAMEETSATDAMTEAKLFYLHGLLRHDSGDPSACLANIETALTAFEEIGNRRESCRARINMGYYYAQLGHFEAAEEALRAGLDEAKRMALEDMVPSALQTLGMVLAHRGQIAAAKAAEEEAREMFARRGDLRMECMSRISLARIHLLAGEIEAAAREARAVQTLAVDIPPCLMLALAIRARALLLLGRVDEALAFATESVAMLDVATTKDEASLVRLVHAEALAAAGRTSEATVAIASSRNELVVRAARISDPSWRARFLEKIPDNARMLELARSWLDEPSA